MKVYKILVTIATAASWLVMSEAVLPTCQKTCTETKQPSCTQGSCTDPELVTPAGCDAEVCTPKSCDTFTCPVDDLVSCVAGTCPAPLPTCTPKTCKTICHDAVYKEGECTQPSCEAGTVETTCTGISYTTSTGATCTEACDAATCTTPDGSTCKCEGCTTHSQGYYKNKDLSSLTNPITGEKCYDGSKVIPFTTVTWDTALKGKESDYGVAQQYIAALINLCIGACSTEAVQTSLAGAELYFKANPDPTTHPWKVGDCSCSAGLEYFNAGPTHCARRRQLRLFPFEI